MKRWVWRAFKALGLLLLLVALAALAVGWTGVRSARRGCAPRAHGAVAAVARRRVRQPAAARQQRRGHGAGMLARQTRDVSPHAPLPTVTATRFATPPATGLRVTWLGHSTMLVEIDGAARAHRSGVERARLAARPRSGPTRWYPPPIAARRAAARSTRWSSRTITTTTSIARPSSRMKDWDTTLRRAARRRRAPRVLGRAASRASSSSTGGSARRVGELEIVVARRRATPRAGTRARQGRDAVGRLRAPRAPSTACTTRATPGCSRRCARSASGWGRST